MKRRGIYYCLEQLISKNKIVPEIGLVRGKKLYIARTEALTVLPNQALLAKQSQSPWHIRTLNEKLAHVKAALEKDKTKEAIEALEAFVHEVEALYKRPEGKEKRDKRPEPEERPGLTPDGYALLKFNAVYMVEQLKSIKVKKQ